jgi:predicted RNA-binding Zn-ribbon protein involved in translation (DUF1610 family)
MSIHLVCSSCNRQLTASDKAAGRKLTCPKCGQLLSVPRVVGKPTSARGTVGRPDWMTPTGAKAEDAPTRSKKSSPRKATGSDPFVDDLAAAFLTKDEEPVPPPSRRADSPEEAEDAAAAQLPELLKEEQDEAEEPESEACLQLEPTSSGRLSGEEQAPKEIARAKSTLQACPDCGKRVSRRAAQCLHCGCPLSAQVISALPNIDSPALNVEGDSASFPTRKRNRSGSCGGVLLVLIGFVALIVAGVIEYNLEADDKSAQEIWSAYQEIRVGVGMTKGEYVVKDPRPAPSSRMLVYFAGGIGALFIGLGIVVLALPRNRVS